MDVQAISTAIAGSLAGLGIRVYDYGPSAPTPPAAFIYPESITYNADFEEDVLCIWVVRFFVSSQMEAGGQAQLNALLSTSGTGSAVRAITSDNTLTDVVYSLRLLPSRNYGVITLPDQATRFFSAELPLEVFA